MKKLLGSSTLGLVLLLTSLAPLRAQAEQKKAQNNNGATAANSDTASPAPAAPAAATPAPSQTPDQTPDQAPDEATKKISELVHAGKYAEAQQLTAGLLIAYPNDQRLIRAKALIEQLIAQSSTPAGAAGSAPAQATPAQPAAAELTGMDKVDYNALIDLVRQAQQTTDLTEQTKLLDQFMDQSSTFLRQHPEQMLLWQLRAASAITLNQPMAGYEAGHKLLDGGAAESNDPGMQSLLGQLKNKGWLDRQQAETLQASADEDRRQQDAVAEAERKKEESAKYTFPVLHVHGISYAYGHLTINEDEAIYAGTDETDHIARSDVETLKVTCNADSCGFYIIPKSGRKYFILPVTEDAVTNQSYKGKVFLKPAVLGNAFMARWHFVPSADNKSLNPPPGGAAPRGGGAAPPDGGAAPPAASAPRGGFSKNSAPKPAPPNAFLNNAAPAPAPSPAHSSAPAEVESAVAPGMAVLHVYREHHMTGMTMKPDIEIDGRPVVKIANAEVVRLEVPAGKHNISMVQSHAKTDLALYDFDMEAGKEYWVRAEIASGFATVKLNLYTVPAEQAETEVKPLKDAGDGESSKKK